jgi:phenylacetate-coenzyme A ligase PaaK-like adenylate-forming protein
VTPYAAGALKRHTLGEWLARRNPLFYGPAVRDFERLSSATLEARRAAHARFVAGALQQALRTPYGRTIGSRDFEDWPLLERERVRERPEAFHGRTSWPTSRASTGGTTGMPLALRRSFRSVVREQAALDWLLRRTGADPTQARAALLRGDDIKDPADQTPPFWIHTHGGRRLVMSSNHLNAETIHHYVEALRSFAPDYLWVYPTALEALCLNLQQSGLTLHVQRVLSSSEVLSPIVRALAATTLRATIVDYYGQAERVGLAWSEQPGEFRFLPGYAHVELIPQDTPHDSGHAYEIVGTTFWNEAMPLVRYRTGDLVISHAPWTAQEREAISLGVRLFAGVAGREGDILIAPDSTRLTGMDHIQRGVEHLIRIQIIQETPRHVRILALGEPGFGDAEVSRLREQARRKIPPSMEVDIEVTSDLERTRLGKTPFVIRRSAE